MLDGQCGVPHCPGSRSRSSRLRNLRNELGTGLKGPDSRMPAMAVMERDRAAPERELPDDRQLGCSVGIMAYNEEANIADAIESILGQKLTSGQSRSSSWWPVAARIEPPRSWPSSPATTPACA